PHVRAERVLEPAGAPVPGLGGVCALLERRPDELQERLAATRAAPRLRRARAPCAASGSVPAARLRVDRPHVSAASRRRELGLLRLRWPAARLRRRRVRVRACATELEHAGHLEPAALLRDGAPRRTGPQRQAAGELLL